jgi:hypothetical protein
MPRPKGVSQLELLRRKQAAIAEQLHAAETKEHERLERHEAQRREIIANQIGDHLKAQPDEAFALSVFAFLASKLTRPGERALFPELAGKPAPRKTSNALTAAIPTRIA